MPYIAQRIHDCYCHATSSLITFELKRRFPGREDYQTSPQHLLDNIYRAYPNAVRCYKQCTPFPNIAQPCTVHDKDMTHYTCTPTTALHYVLENGIPLETNYPYVGQIQRPPPFSFGDKIKVTNIGYVDGLDHAKRILFSGHPILGFMVLYESFYGFKGDGVYKENVGERGEGHAILIMGYGVDEFGDEYYIVLNSWGRDWGQSGYAKILCSLVHPQVFAHGVYVA
ncbi:hypothetical protein ABFS83_06G043500 [Erythranthe nasuta]